MYGCVNIVSVSTIHTNLNFVSDRRKVPRKTLMTKNIKDAPPLRYGFPSNVVTSNES